MLNQNPKPYFNQVAMIESQYESKRKLPFNSNNASLLQNKSPLRQRENTNSINTPSRVQLQNGNKASLSPLRSRRNDSSTTSIRSNAISRRKITEYNCENHNTKVAKFMIDKDNQLFYFCDRCAIPLISNGFKLVKINQQEQKQIQNPRIKQINQFLKQLESMQPSMSKKKGSVNQLVNNGQQELNSQIQKVQQFYSQFYELIDQHKRKVIEQMKAEFQKSSKNAVAAKQKVLKAIDDCTNMKQDILSSMNSVILQVMDHEFRSVMNQYYGSLQNIKQICNSKSEDPIKVRTLSFSNGEAVCQSLIDGLVIQWNDQAQQAELEQTSKKPEAKHYAYQPRSGRPRQQQESDRQNPIQCLDTENRQKSTIKQIGGLFCSFDQ